jgi:hypothetical protein
VAARAAAARWRPQQTLRNGRLPAIGCTQEPLEVPVIDHGAHLLEQRVDGAAASRLRGSAR